MGTAHRKKGELELAKTAYEKALTEHRTPDYRQNLSEVRTSWYYEVAKLLQLYLINLIVGNAFVFK